MAEIICRKCNVKLEPKKTELVYLGHTFNQEFPVCTVCGNVYIPEDVVVGRMRAVEEKMEDK